MTLSTGGAGSGITSAAIRAMLHPHPAAHVTRCGAAGAAAGNTRFDPSILTY